MRENEAMDNGKFRSDAPPALKNTRPGKATNASQCEAFRFDEYAALIHRYGRCRHDERRVAG
jgi:hypothetical protein